MSTLIRGNRDLIKAMNRNLLLNIIRREGKISRKQLTDISGLSVGAVSGIITELLTNGWVLEVGEGDFTGGRRQTLIKLNAKAGYAVGLKLMEKRLVVAVSNFDGQVVYYQETRYDNQGNLAELVDTLAHVVKETLKESQVPIDKTFGIGIGLAGVIYSQTGIVHYSPFFGWRDVPLARLIEEHTQIPVYIENDVNTLTITEQLFGEGRQCNNFVVVTVGRGIGMGIVINGQLYHGAKGGAGEIGHTIIAQVSDNTVNNSYASLESLASDPAIFNDDTDYESILHETVNSPELQAKLRQSGELLGVGLANVINILSPELVIVSGEGIAVGDYRIQPMLDSMRQHTFKGLLNDVDVVVVPTDDQVWARGAANLVLGKVFASPIVDAQVER
ncbi:MAG: ROK family transcriptional regulator [Phototrophicaceae bacterium]